MSDLDNMTRSCPRCDYDAGALGEVLEPEKIPHFCSLGAKQTAYSHWPLALELARKHIQGECCADGTDADCPYEADDGSNLPAWQTIAGHVTKQAERVADLERHLLHLADFMEDVFNHTETGMLPDGAYAEVQEARLRAKGEQ